jgi:hypothetical protein
MDTARSSTRIVARDAGRSLDSLGRVTADERSADTAAIEPERRKG